MKPQVAKAGEHSYYERIGPDGRTHSLGKPFSSPHRGEVLMEAGAVLSLLPKPPARILECGCGTGWFSHMLARSGYDVVGQDVSPDAIMLAREHPLFVSGPRPAFVDCDFEAMDFRNEFQAVVFFDSLHHAENEEKALRCAWNALVPGGVAICSEPGIGHAKRSADVMKKYDVTDKDMHPKKVIALGRRVGFRGGTVFPHAQILGRAIYSTGSPSVPDAIRRRLLLLFSLFVPHANGIAMLTK